MYEFMMFKSQRVVLMMLFGRMVESMVMVGGIAMVVMVMVMIVR